MKYYIIAGESSGDLHGSNLIKELKKIDSAADFRCWGGDLMEAQSAKIVKHYRDLAFMGFVEVLANIRTILNNLKFCKSDILEYQPDVLVLIDYPGFNMRIAEFAKHAGLKVIYYISPQIWAWRQNRALKIKKVVDEMICILPFEKDFYKKFGMDVHYVGHPLLDAIQTEQINSNSTRIAENPDNKPIIAILPGSRKMEVNKMLPVMLEATSHFPGYQFVIAAAPSLTKEFLRNFSIGEKISVVYNETYHLLQKADAAIVTSGTATLETALFEVPQVVCYRGNILSYWIAIRMIKVKFISLVNLILGRKLVQELVQNELTSENITTELKKILTDKPYHQSIKEGYRKLKAILGNSGASAKAANIIFDAIKDKA